MFHFEAGLVKDEGSSDAHGCCKQNSKPKGHKEELSAFPAGLSAPLDLFWVRVLGCSVHGQRDFPKVLFEAFKKADHQTCPELIAAREMPGVEPHKYPSYSFPPQLLFLAPYRPEEDNGKEEGEETSGSWLGPVLFVLLLSPFCLPVHVSLGSEGKRHPKSRRGENREEKKGMKEEGKKQAVTLKPTLTHRDHRNMPAEATRQAERKEKQSQYTQMA